MIFVKYINFCNHVTMEKITWPLTPGPTSLHSGGGDESEVGMECPAVQLYETFDSRGQLLQCDVKVIKVTDPARVIGRR